MAFCPRACTYVVLPLNDADDDFDDGKAKKKVPGRFEGDLSRNLAARPLGSACASLWRLVPIQKSA